MGLFDRDSSPRLGEHREKQKREVQHYHPPRPLSWLSCVLLLIFALMLLYYGGSIVLMRVAGTEVDALANTRIGADGELEHFEVVSRTTMLTYTYRDDKGRLHENTDSLTDNVEEFGETIPVRYFPLIPGWSMLAFRTRDLTTPLLCLFLSVVLLFTGINRLLFLRRKALGLLTEEEAKKEEEHEKASKRTKG
ncbi:MAG: hypothetical protein IJQ36_05845 [Oscillospiraceae bacterium]|nr:hypothetical protein [Oscillospiraceae bacterium]MBQ7143757.1 hypothetical protein [Oscillospiraceae bacterium]